MDDLYAELRVPRSATAAEIKAAKKRRAKETHPDHGGDPEEFHRVATAALVLLDPARRADYDRTGETDQQSTPLLDGAVGLMRQVVDAMLERADPERQDIIDLSIQSLRNSANMRHRDLARLEKQLTKAESNRARLRHKPAGSKADMLGRIMADKIQQLQLEMAECSRAIEAHELAIELLGDYEWQHDSIGGAFSSTSAGTSPWV